MYAIEMKKIQIMTYGCMHESWMSDTKAMKSIS